MLASFRETTLYFFPIDNVPEGVNVVALHVLVLQVEGVLPHVEEEQRDHGEGVIVLVAISNLEDDEPLGKHVPGKDGPAGALNTGGGGGKFFLELLEGAELVVNGGGKFTLGVGVLGGGQVLPEEGVVNVSTKVEG